MNEIGGFKKWYEKQERKGKGKRWSSVEDKWSEGREGQGEKGMRTLGFYEERKGSCVLKEMIQW